MEIFGLAEHFDFFWLAPLVPVALLGVLWLTIMASLPTEPRLEGVDEDDIDESEYQVACEFLELGFERCGPAIRLKSPAVSLVPLIHPVERCFATVYRIPAARKTGWDIVSVLDGESCGLTTGMTHEAGVAPAWPGSFRQIFQDARPGELWARHREALALLRQEGFAPRRITPDDFPPTVRASFRLQRHVFQTRPLRSVCQALWRTVTRRNPHLGPLGEQKVLPEQLRAIRDGLWTGPAAEPGSA